MSELHSIKGEIGFRIDHLHKHRQVSTCAISMHWPTSKDKSHVSSYTLRGKGETTHWHVLVSALNRVLKKLTNFKTMGINQMFRIWNHRWSLYWWQEWSPDCSENEHIVVQYECSRQDFYIWKCPSEKLVHGGNVVVCYRFILRFQTPGGWQEQHHLWSSSLNTGLPCNRLELKSLQSY